MKIKSIRQTGTGKKVEVILEDSTKVLLYKEVLLKAALRSGQELTDRQIGELEKLNLFHQCYDDALNFLSYRPRSEKEVRLRLKRRGYDANIIDKVVDNLNSQNLLNDFEFARYWCDNRTNFNPKSRLLIRQELKSKGIDVSTIDSVIERIDDEKAAMLAAKKKMNRWTKLDYDDFVKKLSNYLKWRGFSYFVIEKVINTLWNDLHG